MEESQETNKKHIAVVGGGFTGLACAYRLAKAGFAVSVYEREETLGGLARGFRCEGWNWSVERYYHHWFASDSVLLRFCRDLGISNQVIFKRPKTVMQTSRGTFEQLDSPLALLRYSDISFGNRVRMGVALAFLKLASSWKKLEGTTSEKWCRRFMGDSGFNAVWKPLLEGKFGLFASKVNMAWLWARIHSRTAKLGTFQGGFQNFTDCLVRRCEDHGIQFHVSCGSIRAEKREKQWTIKAEASNVTTLVDAVVVAAGPAALLQVCPEVKGELSQQPGIALGAIVVLLSLKRPLRNTAKAYWYSLRKSEGQPFLAAIDHSRFIDAKEFGGEVLLYLADYLNPAAAEWQQSDDTFFELAVKRLTEIDSTISKNDIKQHWVFRDAYAQPVPFVNASEKLPRKDYADGLFHASLAHVYPWDRGTNYALALGEDVAALVIAYLTGLSESTC